MHRLQYVAALTEVTIGHVSHHYRRLVDVQRASGGSKDLQRQRRDLHQAYHSIALFHHFTMLTEWGSDPSCPCLLLLLLAEGTCLEASRHLLTVLRCSIHI